MTRRSDTALRADPDLASTLSAFGHDRRRHLAWLGALAVLATRPAWARDAALADANAVRDRALLALRKTDSTPIWFTSNNWDNGAYKPWTDYLAGKMAESEFNRVCANPSDYCLRDVWNLKSEVPAKIDWDGKTPFNWNGVHALALRFFRTGDDIYLKKWLAVVEDYAGWSVDGGRGGRGATEKGMPAALLHASFAWGGIFTALAIIARGLRSASGTAPAADASPFAAMADAPAPAQLARVPADLVVRLANAFATGQGVDLAKFYVMPKYVPNQRVFGLEALTQLVVYFPTVPGVAALARPTQTGLEDVMTRYRMPDGGQLEQSFNYAEDVVFAAARLVKLPQTQAPRWRDDAVKTVDGWNRMAGALATPTGGLPQVGNALWGRFGEPLAPQRYSVPSIGFPYSGYYAMRSEWSPDAAYLFFYYRRAARGHSMAGCNAVQVAAYGRQLLIAGGSENYKGSSKAYPQSVAYLDESSSFKANTIVVDGLSQAGGSTQGLPAGPGGKPDITVAPSTPINSRWLASAEFDFVEGVYAEGYKGSLDNPRAGQVNGVTHHRKVVFVRSLMVWLVVDVLRSEAQHRYTQIWKFAAPKNGLKVPGFSKDQVALDPTTRSIRTTDAAPNAVNLSLQQFGVSGLAYQSYFGEKYGYVAPGPVAEALPATDVHAEWQGSGPQVLLTLISPYRGQKAPAEAVADTSGDGLAGCRVELPGGVRLAVQCSASARRLTLGELVMADADLLVQLTRPGKAAAGLVLAGANSHAFSGSVRTTIAVPTGFRWTADAAGVLTPAYS